MSKKNVAPPRLPNDVRPLIVRVGKDLRKLTGIPESTQYDMLADGRLPKPKRLGKKIKFFVVDTLMDYLEAQS